MDPSLTHPRAKLDRAAEHLDALHAELRRFSEREPHAVAPDDGLDDGWKVLRFQVKEEPPIQLGLVLGDCIHNLRSALDNLVCQLAYLSRAENCDRTQFPICGTPEQFASQVARGRLGGLSDDHIAMIECLQPYDGRNTAIQNALVVVRDFDNIDKHQAIHATLAALDPRPEAARASRGRSDGRVELEVQYVTVGEPLYDGAVIARVRGRGTSKPDMNIQVEFPVRIGFGEIGLAADKVPWVWRGIEAIVESFAPAFGSPHRSSPDG
jgi:hypothetical protein